MQNIKRFFVVLWVIVLLNPVLADEFKSEVAGLMDQVRKLENGKSGLSASQRL